MQVKCKNIQIGYGDTIIVDDISLTINKHEITSIIGPNGSGKSTVLKATTRLLKYQKGEISIGNRNLTEFKPKELACILGVLSQKHSAPADFRVKEMVSYGRMPHQKAMRGLTSEDKKIIDEVMKKTNTYHLRDKSIFECSGGEAQRVWIAMVLAQNPEILFLDEPTTYLDVSHQLEVMRLVKKLNRETGVGIVMVLHDLGQAMEVSDKIIVIKDGCKYAEGTPDEVITPKMLKEVYNVDADVVRLNGRTKPIIVYRELA